MSEYKRLTERTGNNGVKYDRNDFTRTCYPQNEYAHDDIDRMAIRLAELEDKIEQGMLIELPCKVGDMVYVIVKKVTYGYPDPVMVHEIHEEYLDLSHLDIFGKYVFLTRGEAEKRLEELGYGK